LPAVTLDLWHTLMYLDPESEEGYMQAQVNVARRVLAKSPQRPGAPDLSEAELGRVFERVYAEAVSAANEGRTVTPAEQMERAARETGRDPCAEAYLRGLRSQIRGTRFRRAPGALKLLRTLSEDGYRLAVISNTVGEPGAFLRPVLHEMGFDRYVETVIFSDEHPWTKPAPEIFLAALRELGETPDQAVHVGDGWSDLEGARRARFRAGILFTGLHEYGARYKSLFLPADWDRPATAHEVRRLGEVPDLVRSILPVTKDG
jgi:HAD superfamily hydrolase (TIGR01509 family)